MDSTRLPSPNDYSDWQSWAAVLVSSLSGQSSEGVLNIPSFVYKEGETRNGLPIAAKGDLIWLNEGGVRKLAIYDGQKWIKYSPDN